MKAKPQQVAQMQAAYERYKESHLSKAAFCQKEGLSVAQFTYWIKRFDKESQPSAFTQVNLPVIQPVISPSPTKVNPVTTTNATSSTIKGAASGIVGGLYASHASDQVHISFCKLIT